MGQTTTIIDPSFGNSGLGNPASPGIPGWFVGMFVLFVIIGAGITLWRVSVARQMAREAGLDPGKATTVTLLSKDGLDATYLAASLNGRPAPNASDPTTVTADRVVRPAAERLAELQNLLDEGLVTPDEYRTRRQAILDSV